MTKQQAKRIAIIGGAASGVAVLDQLILKATQAGKQSSIQEIVVFEKGDQFARGLAYGTKSDSHILNMANNTMSLRPDDPDHFSSYLNDHEEESSNGFVKRSVFGNYIQKHFLATLHRAAAHGVKVSVKPHSEVTDVQQSDGIYHLSVSGKERQSFDKVFLCMGNLPAVTLGEFNGKAGYHGLPYDIGAITKDIAADQDIVLIGSGLTAIDAYLALREAGHEGKIRFVSRQGILPKVRGNAQPYVLKHLSPDNLATLTNHGDRKISLDDIQAMFMRELSDAGVTNKFIEEEQKALSELSSIEVLKRDLKLAGTEENTHYLSVLKSMDDVIGHIWNSLSVADQKAFDKYYKRVWDAYDYPMPEINAHKILAGLEKGDLETIGGLSGIIHDPQSGEYTIERINGEAFTTKYVINATGQNHDITRAPNTLLQNLQHYGLIQPQPLGGIHVDYATGRVIRRDNSLSNSLYVVGSLTRGVHFYTNSLAENVKAAERSASHFVETLPSPDLEGKTMRQRRKIALFIGSDISSQLLLNRLVPEMQKSGYEPVVCLPIHKPSKKIPPMALQDLAFYERRMINEVIYPFLNEQGIQTAANSFTPEQLTKVYGIEVHEVENINDPDFVASLSHDPELKGGISIRCYQKFGEDIITMFENKGFLWNLHPGILPQYRGVMTLARAMANGETETSYSLHVIDKNWDAGDLLDIRPEPLNLKRPMLSNYCDLAPSGVLIIIENMDRFFAGTLPPALPQDPAKTGYWTFPTPSELDQYQKDGLVLANGDDMAQIYMDMFSGNDEGVNQELQAHIKKAIDQWEEHKKRDSQPQSKPRQFTL